MSSQISKKVRLVRCPKCRQVLAELPDIALYKCGGCGTVLQAKTRKLETDSVPKTEQNNASEAAESRSSNHGFSSPTKGESLLDKDSVSDECELRDSRMGLCEDRIVPKNDLSISPDVNCRETGVVKEPSRYRESEFSLGQNSNTYEGKFHDCDEKWTGSRNFSDEGKESTPEAGIVHVEQDYKSRLDWYTRVDHFEGGESQRVWQEGDNFVKNLSENDDQENNLLSGGGEHKEGIKYKALSLEKEENSCTQSAILNTGFCGDAGVDSSSAGVISRKDGNASQKAQPNTEVGESIEGLSTLTRPSTENLLIASVEDSIIASQSALKGGVLSMNSMPPDDEHLDNSMRKFGQKFGSTSSVDTLGSSPLADPVKHGDMTSSPTTRIYYAYDGSESSYDDYQSPQHISYPSRRKVKSTDHISNRYRVNDLLNSDPEMNYQAASSSVLQGKVHHAMKGSKWNQDEFTETERYSHRTIGNWMRLDKQGCVSSLPFTSTDRLTDHRTKIPSSYRPNLLPPHPGFHLPDTPLYSEPDKTELLRTVCELQDQLNRIQFPKLESNRRPPVGRMEEKWGPRYCDPLTPEKELYADQNHPRSSLQHNQVECSNDQYNTSRLAFSGEAAHYRHQINCSCLHCRPQDCHYRHHENYYNVVHNGNNNNCNISTSSSPQHYTSSELSVWGHEMQPGRQMLHQDREMKRLLMEKYHSAKRHLRPIAGGAPVVHCYHCSQLLQLPADFLVFKKRYHQLQCGACGKVLKFAILKSKHIVPYLLEASALLSREVGNYGDAIDQSNGFPVSHSGSYDDEFMEDGRMKSEFRNKNKGLAETFESIGQSSKEGKLKKKTLGIEKVPSSTSSQLHRLMGYASTSQMLNK